MMSYAKQKELHAGVLHKCGGKFKSWTKRWMVLKSDYCLYYYKDTAKGHLGAISLRDPRFNVRTGEKGDCTWPKNAQLEKTLVIITTSRTYFMFAENVVEAKEWRDTLMNTHEYLLQETRRGNRLLSSTANSHDSTSQEGLPTSSSPMAIRKEPQSLVEANSGGIQELIYSDPFEEEEEEETVAGSTRSDLGMMPTASGTSITSGERGGGVIENSLHTDAIYDLASSVPDDKTIGSPGRSPSPNGDKLARSLKETESAIDLLMQGIYELVDSCEAQQPTPRSVKNKPLPPLPIAQANSVLQQKGQNLCLYEDIPGSSQPLYEDMSASQPLYEDMVGEGGKGGGAWGGGKRAGLEEAQDSDDEGGGHSPAPPLPPKDTDSPAPALPPKDTDSPAPGLPPKDEPNARRSPKSNLSPKPSRLPQDAPTSPRARPTIQKLPLEETTGRDRQGERSPKPSPQPRRQDRTPPPARSPLPVIQRTPPTVHRVEGNRSPKASPPAQPRAGAGGEVEIGQVSPLRTSPKPAARRPKSPGGSQPSGTDCPVITNGDALYDQVEFYEDDLQRAIYDQVEFEEEELQRQRERQEAMAIYDYPPRRYTNSPTAQSPQLPNREVPTPATRTEVPEPATRTQVPTPATKPQPTPVTRTEPAPLPSKQQATPATWPEQPTSATSVQQVGGATEAPQNNRVPDQRKMNDMAKQESVRKSDVGGQEGEPKPHTPPKEKGLTLFLKRQEYISVLAEESVKKRDKTMKKMEGVVRDTSLSPEHKTLFAETLREVEVERQKANEERFRWERERMWFEDERKKLEEEKKRLREELEITRQQILNS